MDVKQYNLILLFIVVLATLFLLLYVWFEFLTVINDKKETWAKQRNWVFYLLAALLFFIAASYQLFLYMYKPGEREETKMAGLLADVVAE